MDERNLRVFDHPTDRHLQKAAHRNMVAVKDRNEVTVELLQGVVNVPGLGVFVGFARDVVNPDRFGKTFKFRARAVV